MTFSLYHCLPPRDKTAWLHFMDLMLQAVPITEHTKGTWSRQTSRGSTGAWTVPCQAHFQALVRDAHKSQGTPQFLLPIPLRVCKQRRWRTNPQHQKPMPYPSLPVIPSTNCVFEHDTLTQPVNPAKNEPRKQWVVSFQASTELACHIIRHVLELVPVQSCEAGLPICVIPRVPAECKQRGSGTGPEKGIKLSHLLSKQPNQCMNHPQEALVMPTIHITQHPSRKACNSGRLPVKIKTAAISHFGVPMTFLSLSTPQF